MKKNYNLLRVHISVLLFALGSFSTFAQRLSNCPASPNPVQVQQADGSTLTIVGKGNRLKSWTETTDGYSIINKSGTYEYATKINGKLVGTGIFAKNLDRRKPAETEFLKSQPKSLASDNIDLLRKLTQNAAVSTLATSQMSFPTKGNTKALMLLIKYPDLPNVYATTAFDNLMNQSNYRGTGSFKDFFTTSSFGQLNITTDVFGWYTAANPYSFYGYAHGDIRATNLVREAVNAAQAAGVDFSQYDNDHDGVVDGIIVVHAGPGAEEGSQGQYIWSHRWALSAGGLQVNYDGVLINEYMVNPERRIATIDIVGRGIFCHEFGHNLGLPDLADTDGGSEGLGEWSLMGAAGWLGNEHSPGNLCAWSRMKLNWLTPVVLNVNGAYTLNPANNSNQVYRINTPLANEYFLLENRQKSGLDIALKGSGLAIYHINTDKTNLFPGSNTVNADENFKGVDLEEADGLLNLDNQVNRGDAGDLFPGTAGKFTFNETTNPNSKTYTGANTNLSISNINIDGTGKALFNISLSNQAPTVALTAPVNGATFTSPAVINIMANAADANGTVAKVEFFNGAGKLGEDLTSPFSYSWGNVAAGSYIITAKATDNLGATTTSAAVNIQVNAAQTVGTFPVIKNSVWKYHDKGINLGTAWTDLNYDDATWSAGAGVLGYGDPVATNLGYGSNSGSKYPSYYFRRSFEVADASLFNTLVFNIRRDDGAVVYLNGVELFRTNMPAGVVSYGTLASSAVASTAEMTYYSFKVPANQLRNGRNVLAVSVHQDNGGSSDATFDMEVKGENTTNQSPLVSITSPAPNSSFTSPANISIAANATDADGSISKVEFFQGGIKLGEDTTTPYSYNWNNVPAGTYALTAKAIDNAGASVTSAVITVSVDAAPVVSSFPVAKNSVWKYHDKGINLCTAWISPAYDDIAWPAGAGVLGYGDPVTSTLSFGPNSSSKYPSYYFRHSFEVADAGSYNTLVFNIRRDDGAVVYLNGVELFRTNMPTGAVSYNTFASSALGSPAETTYYTFRVPASQLINGRNVIAVSVHQDNGGSSDMSFDLEVKGEKAINQSPIVNISSPLNGTNFNAPANITITANATDADGSVSKVEFFQGTTKLGEDLIAPYAFSWNNAGADSYNLTAKATDNTGATATSSTVNVQVNATPTAGGLPIVKNSVWKYHDKGMNLGTSWIAPTFDDATWSAGAGILGYGDPVNTTLGFGPNSSTKYPTYYFRKSIEVADASIYNSLVFNLRRDDGAVVYLNGVEQFRTNMPAGAVAYNTFASSALGSPDETTYYTFRVPATQLRNGRNVIAVSVHQDNGGSSDMSFDMEVKGESATISSFASANAAPIKQENYNTPEKAFRSHPNPFTNRTTISFVFEQEQAYKLLIYNTNGALIKELKSGIAKAHNLMQVEWADKKVPTGLYLLRLETQQGVQTLRVVRE